MPGVIISILPDPQARRLAGVPPAIKSPLVHLSQKGLMNNHATEPAVRYFGEIEVIFIRLNRMPFLAGLAKERRVPGRPPITKKHSQADKVTQSNRQEVNSFFTQLYQRYNPSQQKNGRNVARQNFD